MERRSSPHQVPGIGGDDAARADDTRHLGNSLGRIGQEENDQRHECRVKTVRGKGQPLRVALLEPRHAGARARAGKFELRLGRIDALDRRRRAALDQKLGEGAIATADVDAAQIRRSGQPVEEAAPASRLQTPIIRS